MKLKKVLWTNLDIKKYYGKIPNLKSIMDQSWIWKKYYRQILKLKKVLWTNLEIKKVSWETLEIKKVLWKNPKINKYGQTLKLKKMYYGQILELKSIMDKSWN